MAFTVFKNSDLLFFANKLTVHFPIDYVLKTLKTKGTVSHDLPSTAVEGEQKQTIERFMQKEIRDFLDSAPYRRDGAFIELVETEAITDNQRNK